MARKLRDDLAVTLAKSARQGIVDTIRSSPRATLAELMELLKSEWGPVARSITVGEIIGSGNGRSVRPDADDDVNTRTPNGRHAFDQEVLKVLQAARTTMTATDVRKRVGGTPLQTRTALNRLIGDGKVTWSGQARGTQYRAA